MTEGEKGKGQYVISTLPKVVLLLASGMQEQHPGTGRKYATVS